VIPTLFQFDQFTEDALEVRKAIIEGPFTTEKGPDGLEYTGISKHEVPQWQERISQALRHPVTVRMAFFRMNVAGELPHSWIHSDDICSQYAGLLYLNTPEQCRGGTAFWRHTALDIDRLPQLEELRAKNLNPDWFYGMVNREWKDLTYWEQVGFVGMKWNRFITYPTSTFHSRYPFEGFGTTPADARLVWSCFYDV
jgi:hypothetical protein